MHILGGLRRRARQVLGWELRLRPDVQVALERHGSAYGGWIVCPVGLSEHTVVYSFGIGEDTSFEESLIGRYGLRVEAFDPTPRSQAWVAGRAMPLTFRSHALGLGPRDEVRTLYFPLDPTHVSLSVVPREEEVESIQLPLRRLRSLMADLGDANVDILKMDIEGAEYEVVDDLVNDTTRPAQLLVEFHHRLPGIGNAQTLNAVRRLRSVGYRLFAATEDGQECSFLHERVTLPPHSATR